MMGGDFLPPSGGETPISNTYEVPIIDNSPFRFVLLVDFFLGSVFYVSFCLFFFFEIFEVGERVGVKYAQQPSLPLQKAWQPEVFFSSKG